MDSEQQGDALLPVDLNVDWSLLNDDWNFGEDAHRWVPKWMGGDCGAFEVTLLSPFQLNYPDGNSYLGVFDWNDDSSFRNHTASVQHIEAIAGCEPCLSLDELPVPGFQGVPYPPPAFVGGERVSFGSCSWVNSDIATSITPYQNESISPAVDLSSFASTSTILGLPVEGPDVSMMTVEHQSRCELNLRTVPSKIKRNPTKPRLRCTQAGCRFTFPRSYELYRHIRNVHERTVNVTCPVYGCSRISKPFGRLDKFKEHFRKHNGSENFVCLIAGCSIGPFTLLLLAEHLSAYHLDDHPKTDRFYDTMKIVSPEILGGRVLFNLRRKQQEGTDVCPLKSLGCGFRLSLWQMMDDHVGTHELIDRARCFERIRSYGLRYALWTGLVTCPICSVWQQKHFGSFFAFVQHIDLAHSRHDRQRHAKTLSYVFMPFLLEQGMRLGGVYETIFLRISMELQDAGVLLPVRLTNSATGIQIEKSIEEPEPTT